MQPQQGAPSGTCTACTLRSVCLPKDMTSPEINRFETIVDTHAHMAKRETVFTQGEPLRAVYAQRTGLSKALVSDENGFAQITGFHYPGDVLGLEGLVDQAHHVSAVALESSRFCRVPVGHIERMADELPGMRKRLMNLMSEALIASQNSVLSLGGRKSEARISQFLLSQHRRQNNGTRRPRLSLRISRSDIANFLGMRLETLGRGLARLQRSRVIRLEGDAVYVLDAKTLRIWATQPSRDH